MSKISIQLSGEGFLLTPSLQNKAEEAALDVAAELRLEDVIVEAHLNQQTPASFRALFKTHLKGHDFTGRASGTNLYKAIKEAKEKIIKQIKNYKEKKGALKKRSRSQHHPALAELGAE